LGYIGLKFFEKEEARMIPKIKRILYATDLSENSSYAFIYAVDMAKKHGAKIIILHAIEPIPPYAEAYIPLKETMQQKQEALIATVKSRLEEFCKKAEPQIGTCVDLVEKILVPVGHPPEEILNAANDENCDLIVMGTHGKGFLAHTFLGSVSDAVLRRTRKPVFIIPLPSEKVTVDW